MRGSFLALLCLLSAATAEICSKVSPSRRGPARLNCNVQGSLTKPDTLGKSYILKPINNRSQSLCRDACLENKLDCVSYSYSKKTGECQQYTKVLTKQGLKVDKKSPTSYWNHHCWASNFTTASGIENIGFETGGASLSPWFRHAQNNAFLPKQTKPGSNSSTYSALLQVGTRIGSNATSIDLPFTGCPNIKYFIQPMYQYLGKPGHSLSRLTFGVSGATEYSETYCSIETSTGLPAANASTKWSTFFPGNDSYIVISTGGTEGAFTMTFGLKYADIAYDNYFYYYNDSTVPTRNPVLDQYRVDFNVIYREEVSSQVEGASCSIGSSTSNITANSGNR